MKQGKNVKNALKKEFIKDKRYGNLNPEKVTFQSKKNRVTVCKNSKELAAALGLSPLYAIEWEVRLKITNKIISSSGASDLTVTDISKIAGTSRSLITKILKKDIHGISLDILVRVLGALGEEMKISFKKAD